MKIVKWFMALVGYRRRLSPFNHLTFEIILFYLTGHHKQTQISSLVSSQQMNGPVDEWKQATNEWMNQWMNE